MEEQRRGVRCVTDLHAVVSCPRFGLFRGAVENISRKGLYVRTRNVNMCLDAPVTVTLQADAEDPDSCCEAAGVVVHQDLDGFGVRFIDMDEGCRQLLDRVLSGAPPRSPVPERIAV